MPATGPMTLETLPGTYAVCRLPADAPLPAWVNDIGGADGVMTVTRSADELSIVAPEACVPDDLDTPIERNWSLLRVAGTLAFSEIGILARLTGVLAIAQISVFVFSTYDTDYLMVKQDDRQHAIDALRGAGMTIPEST